MSETVAVAITKIIDLVIWGFESLATRGISGSELYAEWEAAKAEGRPVDVARFQAKAAAAQAAAHEHLDEP